jgi:hypothetical protein
MKKKYRDKSYQDDKHTDRYDETSSKSKDTNRFVDLYDLFVARNFIAL